MITCRETIELPLYTNGQCTSWVITDPGNGLKYLRGRMKYFGMVSQSKLLRFAMPTEFGAFDSRLGQVFGRGDSDSQYIELVPIKVTQECNSKKWNLVYNQSKWPENYGMWIQILRMMALELNRSEIICPHPKNLYENGLRKEGMWECSDVEMALFSYALHVTR